MQYLVFVVVDSRQWRKSGLYHVRPSQRSREVRATSVSSAIQTFCRRSTNANTEAETGQRTFLYYFFLLCEEVLIIVQADLSCLSLESTVLFWKNCLKDVVQAKWIAKCHCGYDGRCHRGMYCINKGKQFPSLFSSRTFWKNGENISCSQRNSLWCSIWRVNNHQKSRQAVSPCISVLVSWPFLFYDIIGADSSALQLL